MGNFNFPCLFGLSRYRSKDNTIADYVMRSQRWYWICTSSPTELVDKQFQSALLFYEGRSRVRSGKRKGGEIAWRVSKPKRAKQ